MLGALANLARGHKRDAFLFRRQTYPARPAIQGWRLKQQALQPARLALVLHLARACGGLQRGVGLLAPLGLILRGEPFGPRPQALQMSRHLRARHPHPHSNQSQSPTHKNGADPASMLKRHKPRNQARPEPERAWFRSCSARSRRVFMTAARSLLAAKQACVAICVRQSWSRCGSRQD